MKSKLVISKLCRSISLNLLHGKIQKRISLTNSNHHHQRNGFYCFGRKVFLSGLSNISQHHQYYYYYYYYRR